MSPARFSSRASLLVSLVMILVVVSSCSQVPLPAHAAIIFAMSLQTDASSYSGAQPITLTGMISPAPGPNTGVIITVKNSVGSLADINEVFPDPITGEFKGVFVPGGNPAWIAGTFTVNATWGGSTGTASKIVTFVYSPSATSTSTTSTTTSTTSSTSSTSNSTSTVKITTTTSSTVPEFPASALAVVALLVVGLVAMLARRFTPVAAPNRGSV